MALQLNDRVKESSITTGVVPIVLAGATTGYQNVASSISTSNTFPYVVELAGGSEWEIGIGQYISANNSIIRTQILNSSNNSNIVNFSAGTKNVFISVPAAYIALTAKGLSQFSSTTSEELLGVISDKTGSGKLVFSNNAVLVTPDIGAANGTSLSVTGNIYSNGSIVLTSEKIGEAAFQKANTIAVLTPTTDIKTSNYTAAINDIVRCNTSINSFTVTFPASPADGSLIGVLDTNGTFYANNLIVSASGSDLIEYANTMNLDINYAYTVFMYNSSTLNWRLMETPIGSLGIAPSANTTFIGTQTFTGTVSTLAAIFTNIAEIATISATAANNTISLYTSSQSVLYYTSAAVGNWGVNLTHSFGTSLDAVMAVGQAITMAFLVTQGATAYYNTSVQVDGTTSGVTTKWQGSAPTSGDANSVDVYQYTVIKTEVATFTVLASVVKYA